MINKISIIIPVYNTEEYLKECLDSILNQTLKEIEIIIVNDCSPDNSEKIILDYQNKDARIKYIKHEKNLGLGGARNTGIKNASAEWISFIDSDDYLDLDCFENLLNLLEKNSQTNFGIFAVQRFDHHSGKIHTPTLYDNMPDFSNLIWFYYCNTMTCNKIFKRLDIVNNNLFFSEHLKHEDEEFWFKYISYVSIKGVGDPYQYYHYRQRKDSITSDKQNIQKDLLQVSINSIDFFCKSNFNTNSEKKRLLLEKLNSWIQDLDPNNLSYSENIEFSNLMNLFKSSLDRLDLKNEELLILNPAIQYLYLIKDSRFVPFTLELLKYNHYRCDAKDDSLKSIFKKLILTLLKRIKLYNFVYFLYRTIKNIFSKN